ncbi:MAG: GNAT family N-acetyltransferase [Saprospiraceae bacterium]
MNAYDYIIRPPQTHEEWDEIKGLLLDYRKEFNDSACFTSFEEEMANVEDVYTTPGSQLFIAVEESDKKIVGCVAMRTLSPGVAEMKRLYVIPSHRGLHLGENLALEIVNFAEEKKYNRMVLDTMHEMHAAQKLYRQLGFTKTEPYRDQDPSTVVCYEKKFTQ